jgi:hypothetical protein
MNSILKVSWQILNTPWLLLPYVIIGFVTTDFRNTPSTTNLKEEEIVDALGNGGNASMPEKVTRPNPWRKMVMMMMMMMMITTKSVEITNKMQPCNRIYYSVFWRLNMFRAAYRSSSGVLNCIYSIWFRYTCGDRPVTTCVSKPYAVKKV